jgi:RNA polymerase sigma-70 factor (ECF subfamily)
MGRLANTQYQPYETQMTGFLDHTDDSLLRLSNEGQEEAFVELYRRRRLQIYKFAMHMSGSSALAEEVTQEVFLSLIRNPETFDPSRGSVAAYLYGIARNHMLRVLEKNRLYVAIEDETVPSNDDTPLGDLTRSETIESVRQAVLSLPANYREAVVLCDLQEVSYADAAGLLAVPIGTVRSRLSRGRAMLVEKLRVSSTRCTV